MNALKTSLILVAIACILLSAQAKATVYDFTLQESGYYNYVDMGPFNNGAVAGEKYGAVFTYTSLNVLIPPTTPFPAVLTSDTATDLFVVSGGIEVLDLGFTGAAFDGAGDALFYFGNGIFTGLESSTSTYTFTGGTGVFADAWGNGTSEDTYTPESWGGYTSSTVTDHLVIPEPATLSLAGLGLLALAARRGMIRRKQESQGIQKENPSF
jgi:hypothetical protein